MTTGLDFRLFISDPLMQILIHIDMFNMFAIKLFLAKSVTLTD